MWAKIRTDHQVCQCVLQVSTSQFLDDKVRAKRVLFSAPYLLFLPRFVSPRIIHGRRMLNKVCAGVKIGASPAVMVVQAVVRDNIAKQQIVTSTVRVSRFMSVVSVVISSDVALVLRVAVAVAVVEAAIVVAERVGMKGHRRR
jgi:hypothetical protein